MAETGHRALGVGMGVALLVSGCQLSPAGSLSASSAQPYQAMLLPAADGKAQVLVTSEGLSSTQLAQLGARLHFQLRMTVSPLGLAVFQAQGATAAELSQLASAPGIQRVERDGNGQIFDAKRLSAAQPPGLEQQWDLQRMETEEAWALRQGSDRAIVAMVDTGCDLEHPQLVNKLVEGVNLTSPGQPPQDDLGHGTATAGIVGAERLDGQGLSGVAPKALLMPVKVNQAGTGAVRVSDAAAGIVWAVDHGANVINLSLGFEAGEPGLTSGGLETLSRSIQHALSSGVMVVCASGNIGNEPVKSYPAAWSGTPGFEGLVSVGALDREDRRASYSNYGPWLTVVAPADDVPSLAIGGYGRFGGTSAAAPHVSGLAALLMTPSRPPSVKTLRGWIVSTARDLGATGRDPQFGAGCVNALKAVQTSARQVY